MNNKHNNILVKYSICFIAFISPAILTHILIQYNLPEHEKQHDKSKKKKHTPNPKTVATIEIIALALSLIAFIYLIFAIYLNIGQVPESDNGHIIINEFWM